LRHDATYLHFTFGALFNLSRFFILLLYFHHGGETKSKSSQKVNKQRKELCAASGFWLASWFKVWKPGNDNSIPNPFLRKWLALELIIGFTSRHRTIIHQNYKTAIKTCVSSGIYSALWGRLVPLSF
jgi:hypothetical protein